MITTSLMAWGLDINNIILVINYDCPRYKEDYIHRIGRTGRAGSQGYSFTLITEEEEKYAKEIIEALKISDQKIPLFLEQ